MNDLTDHLKQRDIDFAAKRLKELARKVVAGEITAIEYLKLTGELRQLDSQTVPSEEEEQLNDFQAELSRRYP